MEEKPIIEVLLPLKNISKEARKEKSRKPKNISTMHIYWARRPTIAARAAILGSLLPKSINDKKSSSDCQDPLTMACTWDFAENDNKIKEMRTLLKKVASTSTIKMIDIFAGGGSIPLEGIRLGLETWAVDVNPVAHLIQKGILEYPQVFGKKLISVFEEWVTWVGMRAETELRELYHVSPKKEPPHAFIWAKVIRCQNINCNAKIPLIKQYWLANKKNKKIALKPLVDPSETTLRFTIVENDAIDFNPREGTIHRGRVKCWKCKSIIDNKQLKMAFRQNKVKHEIIAVVFKNDGKTRYELPSIEDIKGFERAIRKLAMFQDQLHPHGLPFIPQEPAPPKEALGCSTASYGLTSWDKFFNARQLVSLLTFTRLILEAQEEMIRQGYDDDLLKAVSLYLAFVLNRVADYNNILCTWHNRSENIGHMYTRPVLTMRWDYAEINPLNSRASSWWTFANAIRKVLEHLTMIECKPARLILGSATSLPFQDQFFDLVITDPPFYDYISYYDLADFFYVWFKRTIGHLFPEILKWPLTPKSEEIIHSPHRHGSREKSKIFYTTLLTKAFQEARRILKDDGICVIMFTHKDTEAWTSLLQSIQDAGFKITATWPLQMEMRSRMRAMKSATVNSTILVACRKQRDSLNVIYLREFKQVLQKHLASKLEDYWKQDIKGVDFFISAIGPAMSLFGNYKTVLTTTGEQLTIEQLLDLTSEICFKFILKMATRWNELQHVDRITSFYLTWKLIHRDAMIEYDVANKLAKAFQVTPSELELLELIKKEARYVQLIPLPQSTRNFERIQRRFDHPPAIIILKHLMSLLREDKLQELRNFLEDVKREHPKVLHACLKIAQTLLEMEEIPTSDKTLLHLLLSII